jgi:diguanylate cyclase (GGDEF)-like protein
MLPKNINKTYLLYGVVAFIIISIITGNIITYIIMTFMKMPDMIIGYKIATITSLLCSAIVAGLAIKIYTRFNEVKQQSIENLKRDYLTQLYTRKSFVDEFSKYLKNENACKKELCLMLIDLDDFKQINDTYGHLAGDAVLVEIGKRIQSVTRQSDIAARYGGEEFVIVLNNIQREHALEKAKEICSSLNAEIVYQNNSISFSVSIGCIHCKSLALDLNKLLKFTDERLYMAKENGKNRVEMLFYNNDLTG